MIKKFLIHAVALSSSFALPAPATPTHKDFSIMVAERTEIADQDKWNVEAFYPSVEEWERAFQKASEDASVLRLEELKALQGHLGEGAQQVRDALSILYSGQRELEKLYVYAHLRNDEDVAEERHKANFGKAMSLYHRFSTESAWVTPEILSLDESLLEAYLDSPELTEYRFTLERILHQKAHTLSPEQEKLIAQAGQALAAPIKAFGALNNADFSFGTVLDSQGNEHELTHGSYAKLLRHSDRELRKNAFCKLHGQFKSFENTLCELLQGHVQHHLFQARARNHDNCLHFALCNKNIDSQVYHSLISAVRENIGALHKYVSVCKKWLDLPEMHLYDMYVPLLKEGEQHYTYDDAVQHTIASAALLGKEYQEKLRRGLLEDRWVDRYENRNKRSGAYSSGCYDSFPYILMNYTGQLRDMQTLTHEAGHSMHSLLSHENQPHHYGSYEIFVAEVASTFNETLLRDYLMERSESRREKIILLNEALEDLRATLFRQTLFAEFELLIHRLVEEQVPLTPGLLKEKYRELNAFYFGPDVVIDEEIAIEWARIPHFYSNFYVYQYATGVSAALALVERVKQGGEKEREEYLSFLKGGGSRYPLDLLQGAGVDMRSPEPVCQAIATFSRLVDELDQLLTEEHLTAGV